MPWDPDRYLRFQTERFAPFEDLLALIRVRPGLRVIDLGCGTGVLTKRLADHLPESDVVGLDASAEMLARADALTTQCLRFESGSIESVAGAWDLIFSNAALQWVGDHHALIPHLLSLLRPDGQLIIQVPANDAHVSHTALVDLAKEEPYRMALDGWLRGWSVLPLEAYAELLHAHGVREGLSSCIG